MSDIASSVTFITVEQTQVGSVASESLAQSIGQACNWIIDNAKGSPVGSIKHSMLTEAQFTAIAGAGWVLAKGQALLITDQLRILTGMLTVPDMRGTFQRAKAGVEVIDGSTVLSENAAHNHTFSFVNGIGGAPGIAKVVTTPYNSFVEGAAEPANTFRMSATAGVGGVGNAIVGNSLLTATEFAPVHGVANVFIRIN